jgi:hypothetical protein
MSVIINNDVICGCLGYDITAIQNQLMGIASLTKEMSGKSASVTYSKHCINKGISCS